MRTQIQQFDVLLNSMRRERNLSQSALGEMIGERQQTVAGWENGRTRPNDEQLRRLAIALNVTADELLGMESRGEVERLVDLPGFWVPFYDVDITAGEQSLFDDQYTGEPTTRIYSPGLMDCDFACRVSGESMMDRIYPGDIIACKKIEDLSVISYGDIFLVVTQEYRLVKYLRKSHQDGYVVLRSENENYDDIILPVKKIQSLYLVKGIIKKTHI